LTGRSPWEGNYTLKDVPLYQRVDQVLLGKNKKILTVKNRVERERAQKMEELGIKNED